VILPLVGRNEKTLFEPFEPVNRFLGSQLAAIGKRGGQTHQVCPAIEMLLLAAFGVPSELNVEEIGPALKLASQIMTSLTFAPPEVLDVNRSKATFATTLLL